MSPKPRLARWALQGGHGAVEGHVGHQPQVQLGHRAVRQHRLAARARCSPPPAPRCSPSGVKRNRSSDGAPGQVVRPAVGGEQRLAVDSSKPRRRRVEHRLLARPETAGGGGEAVDGRVAVGGDQRVQRLHQVEGGAVEARPVAGVHVLLRARGPTSRRSTPAPARPRPWRPARPSRRRRDPARRAGMKTPVQLLRAARPPAGAPPGGSAASRSPPRPPRPAPGSRAPSAPPRGSRAARPGAPPAGPSGSPRPGPSAPCRSPGLSTSAAAEGRRRPLGGVDLLHVVHEVERRRCAARPRPGWRRRSGARRWAPADALEAGVARQLHHQLAALGHAAVLGGDRGLLHPLLQALDALVVAFLNTPPPPPPEHPPPRTCAEHPTPPPPPRPRPEADVSSGWT